MKTCAISTSLLSIALAASLHGQIAGEVVDSVGHPLSDAVVELWSPVERLGIRITGVDGKYRFSQGEAAGAATLLVRRIGAQAARFATTAGDLSRSVALLPSPILLPDIVVGRARRMCPGGDEARARGMLELASRPPYRPIDSSFQGTLGVYEGRVAGAKRGQWPADSLQPGLVQLGGPALDNWERELIPLFGYALPRTQSASGRNAKDWEYMELEAGLANHFLGSFFRERHDFFVWRVSGQGTEIGFCPREKAVPEIQGVLLLDQSTRLMSAEWTFILPGGRALAGGEVHFLPSDVHLLPTVGFAWRKEDRGLFREVVWVYREWRLADSASH